MHLRKRHGDRKVPALTSCDVFGIQTLRLPYDDPNECEKTELATKKTCDAYNVVEIYDYYSPCDDPVECEQLQGIKLSIAHMWFQNKIEFFI